MNTASVTIKAQFVHSIPTDGDYQIQLDILDVTSIGFDVLVFETETDAYSRVATVFDMDTYPADAVSAATDGIAYYRGRGAALHFASLNEATAFEGVTRDRLKLLAVAWDTVVQAFSKTVIDSVSSDPAVP